MKRLLHICAPGDLHGLGVKSPACTAEDLQKKVFKSTKEVLVKFKKSGGMDGEISLGNSSQTPGPAADPGRKFPGGNGKNRSEDVEAH